uniref:Uncharacterized protein n=1 Tax=Steinernema glaseri TaxID=37863 RepID=A0A1I8AJY3_9BILA
MTTQKSDYYNSSPRVFVPVFRCVVGKYFAEYSVQEQSRLKLEVVALLQGEISFRNNQINREDQVVFVQLRTIVVNMAALMSNALSCGSRPHNNACLLLPQHRIVHQSFNGESNGCTDHTIWTNVISDRN